MKKIFLSTLIIGLFASTNISFGCTLSNIFTNDKNKKEVYSIVKKHSKAMRKYDIEKIKSFYHDDYISTDGFSLSDLENMLKKTHSSYKNIKYKTKINNIMAYDNWALVHMSDKTKGIAYSDEKEKTDSKAGILEGASSWNLYLKKENDSWKIISEDILMEETSLKYGIAQKINMDLITPMSIENGEEYNISLKVEKPKDIIALASISKEEITYPPKNAEDKYRKIPQHGDLERLVRANNKNINEYGIAMLGFTKVSINEEETKAKVEVLGMAYIMKRINIKKNGTYLLTKGEDNVKR